MPTIKHAEVTNLTKYDYCMQDLLLYQLPENAHFYSELVGHVEEASQHTSGQAHATVSALFTKFDAARLERVVGAARAKKMLKAEAKTFLYC